MSLTSGCKVVVAAGLMLLGGCSNFDSSFVYSERTLSLMPEAQNGFSGAADGAGEIPGLRGHLDARFGDPQNLRAWTKLPVDFGGGAVTVVSYREKDLDGNTILKLEPAADSEFPSKAGYVEFISGGSEGHIAKILSWDAATGTATLDAPLPEAPSPGDTCSIDRGHVLKTGRSGYMRHCSHCHGTSGDGNGPTAQYLNPRPRDYRHGVFKFTSTNDMSRASRDDLSRILKYGIPGTYMPSFLLLEDDELHAIVEYVRFLALRGEYERMLVNELSGDYSQSAVAFRVQSGEKRESIVEELKEILASDFRETAESRGDDLAETWEAADSLEAAIVPKVARVADSLESRRKGRELYLSRALNCADCHGIDGEGNGPQTIAFEKNPITGEFYAEPGLHDVWDNLNQPRNLKTGIYRGGRRPIDLFCRIQAGIKGSRMPSFKTVSDEDIWHIVNYVLSIPFQSEPGATGVLTAADVPAAQ